MFCKFAAMTELDIPSESINIWVGFLDQLRTAVWLVLIKSQSAELDCIRYKIFHGMADRSIAT